MGDKSRAKGKKAERELLNLLGERLGQRYERNLNQSAVGGCDCTGLDGIALELPTRGQRWALRAFVNGPSVED